MKKLLLGSSWFENLEENDMPVDAYAEISDEEWVHIYKAGTHPEECASGESFVNMNRDDVIALIRWLFKERFIMIDQIISVIPRND